MLSTNNNSVAYATIKLIFITGYFGIIDWLEYGDCGTVKQHFYKDSFNSGATNL